MEVELSLTTAILSILPFTEVSDQGVTKRCLSWLTNSALLYEPNAGGEGGVAGSQLDTGVQLDTGAQMNFGDLTPYLTSYVSDRGGSSCFQRGFGRSRAVRSSVIDGSNNFMLLYLLEMFLLLLNKS
jgi:hypothetical protein